MTAPEISPTDPDRVPAAAWAMAWLFLVGQAVDLLDRGTNSSDLPHAVLPCPARRAARIG